MEICILPAAWSAKVHFTCGPLQWWSLGHKPQGQGRLDPQGQGLNHLGKGHGQGVNLQGNGEQD